MICFYKNYNGINFLFNSDNSLYLLRKLETATIGVPVIENIRENIKNQICTMEINLFSDEDYVFYKNNRITFWFSEETLEYAIYKITDFLAKGDFYPSEFGDFIISNSLGVPEGNRRRKMPIYFIKE
ncbi:hypothetical protein EKN56_11790 [Limnobaculum zhutongyuii]|uniref:Uncharacterized protein n=1 Tax=Limnobaculum zhutongyuii TaxID=2498113 RepID=A0A411WLL2_9GAMM|nr:hypothetical protein [Limnobaculum zhutongyuii]QBH97015.1 hypothetical protein EKN56_11790 [Limnobaculum zhutongyuii]TQS87435.1 hypothetical protein ELQ32_14020 [Limnobaculum zhutongyuii]